MNVAMLTLMAIRQGLCLGTQGRSLKRHLLFSVADYTVSYRRVRREARCKEVMALLQTFEEAVDLHQLAVALTSQPRLAEDPPLLAG